MDTVIVMMLALAYGTLITLVRGWVLSVLWSWLIVPAFGLNPVSPVLAIGFLVIVALATNNYATFTKFVNLVVDKEGQAKYVLSYSPLLSSFVALGLGYIVKGIVGF